MSNKRKKVITVRTDGKPDLKLAAVLFAPLFLKIHERNQSQRLESTQKLERSQALARQGSNGRTRLSDTEFATPSLAGRKAGTFTAWGGIY